MPDNQSYIISFFPGTSGKFIAQVLWRMINDLDDEIVFTPENSAHVSYPWQNSWMHPTTDDPNNAGTDIFKELTFSGSGILATQMYPEFNVINDRLPNTKLIIIAVEEDDLLEIAFNHITKNTMVSQHYRGKLESKGHELNNDLWKQLIIERQIDLKRWYKLNQNDTDLYGNFSKYYNVYVPEDFLDNTLIIKYSDIYKEQGDSFVALEKIKEFAGKEANQSVIESYNTYVMNRNKAWNK
jgi:hypothetical protein